MEIIRKYKIRISIIIFLFIAFLGRYEYKMPKRNFADFHVYYYTAQKLIEKENIYDDNVYRKDKVANFKYPPIVGVIFYPLGFFGEHAAAVTWYAINFILILMFFYWSSSLVFDKKLTNKERNWIYFLASLFTLRFFMYNFDEGQVNFLMMSMLTFSLFLLKNKKKSFLSGLILSFSSLIKYMSCVFIPYILFKKRYKVFVYFCLGVIVFSFLPAFFLGFEYNLFLQKNFLPFLCKTSLDFNSMSTHENQSLIAMMLRYLSPFSEYNVNVLSLGKFHLGFLIGIVFSFLYGLILYPSPKFKNNVCLEQMLNYSMLFICVALFNPNGWIHAFIFLTFPYLVCFYYLFKVKHKDKMVWVMAIVSGALATWPDYLFIRNLKDSEGIYSLLGIASLILFFALVKIKFSPVLSLKDESHDDLAEG